MGEAGAELKDPEQQVDAGAAFVLQSKGTWLHAAYHLTTSIVGPAILSLPYAFASLGWGIGIVALTLGALVTFYGYNLLSRLLELAEERGQRHLRLGDLVHDILGPRWSLYAVVPSQLVISFGIVVGSNLLSGQGMLKIYQNLVKNGELQLYSFIIISASIMILLSQLPSFHSLRYVSLLSALLSLGYSIGIVAACIYAGTSHSTPKHYNITGSTSAKVFHSFNALAIIASCFGASIIAEIQATIASPVYGKMFKGLLLCYAVVGTTFFSVTISGYWAFGNKATGNLFDNFIPDDNTTLAPDWLLFLIILFIVIQLLAIAVVYSQPLFDVFEAKLSDVKQPICSARNLVPRLLVRSVYIAFAAFVAAMLPFFGDMNAFLGAVGFLPMSFVLPAVLYNIKCKPSPRSLVFWINTLIIVVYASPAVLGTISSIRQIVVDAHTFKLFSNNTT